MDIQQAVVSHYQEVCPHLQTRDNILVFPKEGVIVMLDPEHVVLLTEFRHPYAFDVLINRGHFAQPARTTLDKMNQKRAWKELVKHSRCRYLDYCDPRLFDIIDEALHVPPLPVS